MKVQQTKHQTAHEEFRRKTECITMLRRNDLAHKIPTWCIQSSRTDNWKCCQTKQRKARAIFFTGRNGTRNAKPSQPDKIETKLLHKQRTVQQHCEEKKKKSILESFWLQFESKCNNVQLGYIMANMYWTIEARSTFVAPFLFSPSLSLSWSLKFLYSSFFFFSSNCSKL